MITSDSVARAHAEGYVVWAFMDDAATQENADFYASLVALGVDGVLVGRPGDAVARLRD